MNNDVFICHSTKDADLASKICDYLEQENKLHCWIAPRNITGGKLYAEEIMDAIEHTQVFILLYSKDANLSNHVVSELNCAFNCEKPTIPFCIDDSKMRSILMYYTNTSQSITAFPEPLKKLGELKDAVMRNIPQMQEDLERAQAYALLADDLGMSMAELKVITGALKKGAKPGAKKTAKKAVKKESPKPSPAHDSGNYDMLVNAAGEVLIIIEYRDDPPEGPRLVYDGGDQILFYRSRTSAMMLNNIEETGREALKCVSEVLLVEIESDDLAREYKVPVRLVRSLKALG